MAKKSRKTSKKVVEANVAVQTVEEVFAPVPVGLIVNPGVSAKAVAAYENKSNGGSQEAEAVKADVIEAEIPVGGFNRNGMDAMMMGTIAPEVVVVDVAKSTKKSRIALSGGYRGTVRKMLLEGNTGEEIINTIADMYEAVGMSHEYGFERGKRILGDMEFEKRKGIFG